MNRAVQIIKLILIYVVTCGIVVLWISPLIITVFTAMKPMSELMGSPVWWAPPENWSLDSIIRAWVQGRMRLHILNTFAITIPSVVITLALSSLAAYALSRFKFPGVNLLLMVFVGGNLIPLQMLMIPVYRFTQALGIYDTHMGVIIMHASFQTGFCTFFLRNFMRSLPDSLFEAARIDGVSEFTIFLRIAVPLVVPAFAALGILVYTWVWNDYLWSLILIQSDRLKPVTLGLTLLQGQYVVDWNIISGGALIAAIPPIIIFFLFQRYFIGGLTMGALKD